MTLHCTVEHYVFASYADPTCVWKISKTFKDLSSPLDEPSEEFE